MEKKFSDGRPWAARRPQNYVLSVIFIVLAVALVRQGIASMSEPRAGMVPVFIIIGGPVLAVYYIWYLCFRQFENDANASVATQSPSE